VHHDESDCDEVLGDEEDSLGELQGATEAPRASWMDREPPVFYDEIVFTNPVQSASRNADEPDDASAKAQELEVDQKVDASAPDADNAMDSDFGGELDVDDTMSEKGDSQANDKA
jgi:hypothetical protein